MSQATKVNVFTAYKRVDKKVKPVPTVFPEDAKVKRQFPEDPLDSLPNLPSHPPVFIPTQRLTTENVKLLNIDSNDFLWPEEKKLFLYIMSVNERTLAFDETQRGTLRDDYFSPYIIPVIPHTPWEHHNIPIPPALRDQVIALLKEKIKAGVYEPSQSSYRSRWFTVLKKNGTLRIVHDLQALNSVTVREAGLPPVLESFVEPFAGCQCYTLFDMYWGFDARKVHPSSRDLTSFLTPLGLLRITSMPMGFTNSPAEFQACMVFILQDEIPNKTNIFIDDLPIMGPKTQYLDKDGNPETIPDNPGIRRFIWEHAQDVHRIMHRIGHAGGTFAPKKAQICRPEVIIVGNKCSAAGRVPDDSRVQKILEWPTLATVKDVRGFLGLCGTVRIWIKNYSEIARPLTELVRKNISFIWDRRRQEAFDQLKHLVTSAPALRPIDYKSDKPIVLSVDTSKIAVGIILSQEDEEGRRHPARYGSIPMSPVESNYSQAKLELYGLFIALRRFRLYLAGVKRLVVEVDAKYIKGMLNTPDLQPIAVLNRWIQGIKLYTFELVHVPADKHRGPDALSRRQPNPHDFNDREDDDWLDDIALYAMTDNNETVMTMSPKASVNQSKHILSFLSVNQERDTLLQSIKHFLLTLETPEFDNLQAKRKFLKKAVQFFVKNGNLYKRNKKGMPLQVILDTNRRQEILTQAHERLGHRGEQAVLHTLQQRFYWPNLYLNVIHHIRSCHECQIRSLKKPEIPLTISTPATLFTKIYVDVMYMPKSGNYRYIVAARDDLSRVSEGRALRNNNAESLARFFWEQVICRYGHVGQVVTDNGPEVQSAFAKLLQRYGIPQVRISAYNSRANGVVERGHYIIREAIVKSCQGKIKDWPNKVPLAFFADKITTSRVTGFSPYYLLHGVHPVLPIDLFEATFLVQGFKDGMPTEELLALRIRQLEKHPKDIEEAAKSLASSRMKSKEQFEKRYQKRITKKTFGPGDLVLIRNSEVEQELSRKVKPRYIGPYRVVRQTRGGSYVLAELDGTVRRSGVAAFRLIPYISREDGWNSIEDIGVSNSDSDGSDAETE